MIYVNFNHLCDFIKALLYEETRKSEGKEGGKRRGWGVSWVCLKPNRGLGKKLQKAACSVPATSPTRGSSDQHQPRLS